MGKELTKGCTPLYPLYVTSTIDLQPGLDSILCLVPNSPNRSWLNMVTLYYHYPSTNVWVEGKYSHGGDLDSRTETNHTLKRQ